MQVYLCNYSQLKGGGVKFEVPPLSSYALIPTMLPLLETLLEIVSLNNF